MSRYICPVDPSAFDALLEERIAAHNEQERDPARQYVRIAAEEGVTAFRILRGRDYDLIAVVEAEEVDGALVLDVHTEDIPSCVSRADETEAACPSSAPRIAAIMTKLLAVGVALWASVWGISYLLGNRDPYLPLIVPIVYWCFFAFSRFAADRPRNAESALAAFIEGEFLATRLNEAERADEVGTASDEAGTHAGRNDSEA